MKAHAKWVRPSRPVPEIWVHDESPEMVTEGSAMAKAPAGTTEDPAMVEEVGSEDELEDITPVMEEIWTPPYHVPESSWSVPGPLDHAQTPHYTFCLLCEKWCSAGHLMSAGILQRSKSGYSRGSGPENSTSVRGGRAGGDVDPVEAPDLVAEDDPRSQAGHLQMAYYRAQEGTFRGEIPPEMDENLKKVLEEVREHPRQPVVQPAASDDEAWGVGAPLRPAASCYATQAPSDSAQAATAPEGKGRALASSAATNAGACGIASTAGACGSAPAGGTFANTAAVAASYDSGPAYSWKPTPAPRVGAVYSTRRGKATE